jgi:hypothetical protein
VTDRLLVTVWDGACLVGPAGPAGQLVRSGLPDSTGDEAPPVTLAVSGGLLVWPWVLDGAGGLDADTTLTRLPVAVLDDVTSAQDWLWALFGPEAALAVDTADAQSATVDAPGWDWLPVAAARRAFGVWLATWWPASTTDAVPALDLDVLRAELEPLGTRLDRLFDGVAPPLPTAAPVWRPAAGRYALAAGPAGSGSPPAVGVRVSTGVGGTCWSDWPAGWVDASDRAVSWRLEQDLDRWSFQVRATAGPTVVAERARLVAHVPGCRVELRPGSDAFGRCWLGEATGPPPAPAPQPVRVYLPGFAPDTGGSTGWHDLVRALVRARLAALGSVPGSGPGSGPAAPWRAEHLAADDDV